MDIIWDRIAELDTWQKALLGILIALVSHLVVIVIRKASQRIIKSKPSLSKTRTVISVVTSILVFVLYFAAIGYVAYLMGVPIKAYLASAGIIGLAIAFGSQGIVQDVVSGVTIVLSDLFDIGDMVKISSETGIVKRVGMRFTVLRNAENANVYLPNRGIKHVVNYTTGYSEYFVDVILPRDSALKEKFNDRINLHAESVQAMYPGIFRGTASISIWNDKHLEQDVSRVCFRLWPNNEGPLRTNFMKPLYHDLTQYHSSYEEWNITLHQEVDEVRDPFSR